MKRLPLSLLTLLLVLNASAIIRNLEIFEGRRISAPMPLDSALLTPVIDFSECEFIDFADLRYDIRGDSALHETLGDTRRDFIVRGDSIMLFRQEWVNRYCHADSAVLFAPDGISRTFT